MRARAASLAAITCLWPVLAVLQGTAQTLDQKARALIGAYPDSLAGYDGTFLIWKDGTKMPFGDGRADKPPGEMLDKPDIADMFRWTYAFDGAGLPATLDSDPGRIRNERFFNKMYGGCDKVPQGECKTVTCKPAGPIATVPWVRKLGGKTMQAATVNGVAEKLRAVSAELEALGPAYAKYLVPDGGSYVPRCIAGTGRLSVHSFGIAFDINPASGQYWQNNLPGSLSEEQARQRRVPLTYKNRVPLEIVKVFEKHGFIWGGAWYHFDGMHFEYRPEFLTLRTGMNGG